MPTQLTGVILAAHATYRETIIRICLNSLASQWEIETTTFHYFIVFLRLLSVFLVLWKSPHLFISLVTFRTSGVCFKYKVTQRMPHSLWKSNKLLCSENIVWFFSACRLSPFSIHCLSPSTPAPYWRKLKYDCPSQKDLNPCFKLSRCSGSFSILKPL